MNHQHIPLFPTLVSAFDLEHTVTNEMMIILKNNNIIDHSLLENGASSYGATSLSNISEFKNLFLEIQKCIDIYTNEAGIESCILTESWFNILRKGTSGAVGGSYVNIFFLILKLFVRIVLYFYMIFKAFSLFTNLNQNCFQVNLVQITFSQHQVGEVLFSLYHEGLLLPHNFVF